MYKLILNNIFVTYIIHYNNAVRLLQVIHLMRNQYPCFLRQISIDALLEQVFAHVDVHSGQWVIQQINIRIPVYGTCQIDPGFLPPAEGRTSLPYKR